MKFRHRDRGRVDRPVIRQPRLSPHPSGHYIGYGLWLTNDGTEGATSGPRRPDLRVNPTPDTGGWTADGDPELGEPCRTTFTTGASWSWRAIFPESAGYRMPMPPRRSSPSSAAPPSPSISP